VKGHGDQNEIQTQWIHANDQTVVSTASIQISAQAKCAAEFHTRVLGTICLLGQILQNMYIYFFDFTEKTASNPTVATLIFLSVLLTGLGIYDNIGQYAGAGSAVPVTGFANSIASAAIEHRSEGYVLGVGGNMFKLAGAVIVFGVVAAFIAGIIKSLMRMMF
jgi:stage V sporulation protein AC